MCLKANIFLILLSYQCLTIHPIRCNSFNFLGEYDESFEECLVPLPSEEDFSTPIPSSTTSFPENDHLKVKRNSEFKLSCPPNKTLSHGNRLRNIMVKCLDKDSVEFEGKHVKLKDLKCQYPEPVPVPVPDKNMERLLRLQIELENVLNYVPNSELKDHPDCILTVPYRDYNMPVPYEANTTNPSIIRPNVFGKLVIKRHEYFRMSCTGNMFQPPVERGHTEILLRCMSWTWVEYNGAEYDFSEFKCSLLPRSSMIQLEDKSDKNNTILSIGFRTTQKFLNLYRINFNTQEKNPRYAWYTVNTPYPMNAQISSGSRPTFVQKTTMYGNINVNYIYMLQPKTLAKVLHSKELSQKYINMESKFLARGHLVPKYDFNYVFEQAATFYYENTAPQWQEFNDGLWKDVERLFRKNIATTEKAKHLIVIGTYGLCTLPNRDNIETPIHLGTHRIIAVPKFIWKMDYNVDNKTGVVFIGLNNPYQEFSRDQVICDTMNCPGTLVLRPNVRKTLIYCCSKESFEKVYGQLNPVVYEDL